MGIMQKTAEDALAAMSHTLVERKKCLDMATCKAELDKCKGAVMIAYPAYHRLPWYDPTRMECENKEELDGRSEMQDILDGGDSSMWWAGKELQTDKKMREDDDDSYMESEWANPKGLKNALLGNNGN